MLSIVVRRAIAAVVCATLAAGMGAAGAVLVAAPAAAATVINVPADKPTIQAGIDAAANGDQVVVAPGTYTENINFHGKAIEVKSAQGPSVTTIDGHAAGSVVTFNTSEGTGSVLRGFTVTNGSATQTNYDGGGVNIASSSPTVVGNVITANHACDGGGGVYASFSSAVIQDNTISHNDQQSCSGGIGGGGVAIGGSGNVQLLHNTISNNSFGDGGGVTLFAAGTPTVFNNQVTNNTATYVGAGFWIVNQSDAAITQNVISGNQGDAAVVLSVPSGDRGAFLVNNTITTATGVGVRTEGFVSTAQIWNNIITNSTGAAVSCDGTYSPTPPPFRNNDAFGVGGDYTGTCAGTTGTHGNISADPKFAAAGDFHLAAGSPAINHGSNSAPGLPSTDIDGQARIAGGTVDQGVDEFVASQAAPSAPRNVTVVRDASGSGITVSWQAPADTGGSPITGYKVRVLPEDRLIKVGPTVFSVHITGVVRSTSHTIAVSAMNANGTGPAVQVRLPADH